MAGLAHLQPYPIGAVPFCRFLLHIERLPLRSVRPLAAALCFHPIAFVWWRHLLQPYRGEIDVPKSVQRSR